MAKVDHLQMIQGVINRMAANSFMLKGWSITVTSAVFVLMLEKSADKVSWLFLSFIPLLMFWGLDGYFLRQERLFRKLYQSVCDKKEDEIDYSMNTKSFSEKADSLLRVCISDTLLAFHGSLFGLIGAVILLLCVTK